MVLPRELVSKLGRRIHRRVDVSPQPLLCLGQRSDDGGELDVAGLNLSAAAAPFSPVMRQPLSQNLNPKPSKGPCVSTSYLNSVAPSPVE